MSLIMAGPITFNTVDEELEIYLGEEANYVEFFLGATAGTDEEGVYWSYGFGNNSFQTATSIAAKSGASPADKTKTLTNRILWARRKVSGSMTTVLEVELVEITSTSLIFNVITANSNLTPIMKVY